MQLYVLDRGKNTLETTADFYNDKHHKELTAGASSFEFTVDKTDAAAKYMITGNYVVFQDDHGRAWSFTILSYDETQTTKTIYAQDVSIELLNKAIDIWNTTEAHSFAYYFEQITKDTPWQLGINQVANLSRKLVYTGRDTGLGRLLSILKGFDNAECQFNVVIKGNQPIKFIVDVYKTIGTVQKNSTIVYSESLNDIKKTESRAQFVTALAGVGGIIENQATTDPGLEKHIDFTDLEYKDENFKTIKGDKFLRATKSNAYFNPGNHGYIEDFYEYDTQSPQELLNRTLTQLKERSEPQYTYDADVKVIDPAFDIGDTVTIIDHEYNPALYLQARVATLDKSYTDPAQGTITFCNYQVLSSNDDQLRQLQNIINKLPTSDSLRLINSNIIQIIATNEDLKKQVVLALESADGKSKIYFDAKPKTAKNGDVAFVKNADGVTEIWAFVEGAWKLDTGLATFEDVKKAASAAADAGSQAVIAGQQASAAGADAKSAGDFAASAASQSTIETAAAKSAANSAVDQAKSAISQAGFANDAADQAKSAAASAKSDAADALAEATKSFNDAQNAISNATKAMDAAEQNRTTVTGLTTKVDDITGTIQTLATTQSVDKLAGTVTTVQNLAQFASDGLKLKADSSTVSSLDGRVTKLSGQLDVQADKIAAKVTANDVTGMLNGYATQSWSQGILSAAKNEISASVEKVQTQVDNSAVGTNLYTDTKNFDNLASWNSSFWWTKTTDTYNGLAVMQTTQDWNGLSHFIQVKKGDILTYSVYAKYISGTGTSNIYWPLNGNPEGSYSTATTNLVCNAVTITDSWQRVSGTIVATSDGYLRPRIERTTDNTNTLQIAGIKLEKGSKATDWCLAPEDQATVDWTKAQLDIKDGKISAAVTSLKSDITNATAGMATQTWTQGRLDLTASSLTSQISSVRVGGTNLLMGTETETGAMWFSPGNNLSAEKLNGCNVETQIGDWQSARYLFDDLKKRNVINTTDDFVFSAMLRVDPTLKDNPAYINFYSSATDKDRTIIGHIKDYADGYWHQISVCFKFLTTPTNADVRSQSLRFELSGSNGATVYWTQRQLEKGNKATDWSAAPEDVQSQFTQLQNDINLRVKTGDLINQINISTEGILIDGSKTHITNTTMIDNGVIKTASIADAAITTAKISELAVNTAQIADAAINSAKIASLAVGSAQIADGAISSAKIGNAAITSAKIADASILDAKIVSLDGSKIVANSITADKLDVNAIAVGLNQFGIGWQITPTSIAFLPNAGSTKSSLAITGDLGIMFGDIGNGENLAVVQGTPYDTKTDTWYNGLAVNMLNNGDYFGLSADTGTTTEPKMIWSRSTEGKFNIKKGFSFYDDTFFAGNVTTNADLFINRIGVKDANNNGHALKYNWVDGVGIAQLAGNGKAGVLIEEVGGDVKFLVDGSQYSLRDIIIHAMHWA